MPQSPLLPASWIRAQCQECLVARGTKDRTALSPFSFPSRASHPTAAPAPQLLTLPVLLSSESSARDPEVRGETQLLQGLGLTPAQNIPACGGQGGSLRGTSCLTPSWGPQESRALARNLCTDPANWSSEGFCSPGRSPPLHSSEGPGTSPGRATLDSTDPPEAQE